MFTISLAGRVLLAAVLAPLLTAAGCGTPRPVVRSPDVSIRTGDTMTDAPIGELFEIERGAAVTVEGQRLRFEAIREDSRCPQGTTCVWAGEAHVAFTFVGARGVAEIALTLPGGATAETEPQPAQSAERSGYRFTLLALAPYPGSAGAEANDTPVATIRVDPVGG